MSSRILIVDDEPNIVASFDSLLSNEGYQTCGVFSPDEAEQLLNKRHFEIILLDLNFPGRSGLDLLQKIVAKPGHPMVLVISGQAEIKTAIDALRVGASDYLEKPVDPVRLISTVRNLVGLYQAKRRQLMITDQIEEKSQLVGNSTPMRELEDMILMIGPTDSTVLITGENGTGKELVATRLFLSSNRRDKPFVKVNCPGIPASLFESELFGYRKGAFTGADKDYPGKFRLADSGTIFLDEIGDLPRECQAKLLRVLETGEIETLGSGMEETVDARIVCATNRDLASRVKQGDFREDLFYRISVITIQVPPLRERPEDIPLLVGEFLRQFDPSGETSLAAEALALISGYEFPGNVRQLRNLIERLTIFYGGTRIGAAQIESTGTLHKSVDTEDHHTLAESLHSFEKNLIAAALSECGDNITKAAEMLGIDRANLSRKVKEHNLKVD